VYIKINEREVKKGRQEERQGELLSARKQRIINRFDEGEGWRGKRPPRWVARVGGKEENSQHTSRGGAQSKSKACKKKRLALLRGVTGG